MELSIKEFYEINGTGAYEHATSVLSGLWPIKKITYGFSSSDNYDTRSGRRNYIVLYNNEGNYSHWWLGYQRKLKFVLSNGEVVIIDGTNAPGQVIGETEDAEPIKKLMKFIDNFNDDFMGNLYNMEDDTFEDI